MRAAGAGPEHGAAGGQHQVRPQAPRQVTRASNEGYPKVTEDFTITEKAPTRASPG